MLISLRKRETRCYLPVTDIMPSVLEKLADVQEAPSITIREMTDLVTASWEKQEEVVFFGG
jgi:hypothetical protein